MIVYRLTWPAKPGCTQQMVQVFKQLGAALPNPSSVRIYSSHPVSTPGYVVIGDFEFESLAALEQWLLEGGVRPEIANLLAQAEALTGSGVSGVGGGSLWVLE
ncbi:MAG: hypothetical protein JW934_10290 [Anaerolineae bacterium]|nr:hypothetical protein [Anaerolineae bacterium]